MEVLLCKLKFKIIDQGGIQNS